MAPAGHRRLTWNTRRHVLIGLGALVFVLGFIGVWSVRANIAGAVIGIGVIEVSTTFTAVQHPIGGVVAEIRARDGDRVSAGDVVIVLDDYALRSELKVIETDLYETLAGIARLEAALEGRKQLQLDEMLQAAAHRPDVAAILRRNQAQLDAFFATADANLRLLTEQVSQIEAEIAGSEAQLAAKRDELDLTHRELVNAQDLSERGLIKLSDLLALERAEVDLRGEIGRLEAVNAGLRGRISETRMKHLSLMPEAIDKLADELNRMRPERTRFLEGRATLLQELTQMEIRAPVSGRVYDSRVLGLRSVVVAASPLMMIVPDDVPILAKVRIASSDIDQAYVGQDASLKFKAFNGRQIPIILGQVAQISADAFTDPRTMKPYYEVKIILNPDEMIKLGDRTLIPGMPVEAFLSTETRTPLSYVMRPFLFYFDRAFRDS